MRGILSPYAPDARFSDPVFGELRGGEPGTMRRMLTARARDLSIDLAEHDDAFSFHAWARQALGTPGLLLGWTPPLRASVRRRARGSLERFVAGGA
jgi:hypothetical protein